MSGLFMNSDEIMRLGKLFNQLDVDKDGFISFDEIENVIGTSSSDISLIVGRDPNWRKTLQSLDVNGDGRLDYNEFLQAASNRFTLLNEDNIKRAFAILDKDGDGSITADELKSTFTGNISACGTTLDLDFW